ncbi:hypothetical protein DB30_04784 [Enhygromyxa salina]|uniref:Uncharacterized protein n=1 Tax=Enhygromyxa salina TaxID=215803 RepID=A0A0C1ZF95_9BACT|nr:hypothetical protein [Enhygromyxa salina]KIG16324.1 hypothetical protein DB30_04784 [Enhygromyxa salina]
MKLSLLALLMIPLLLILNVPVLAAVVPSALLTVASVVSFGAAAHEQRSLPPAAQVLGPQHVHDLQRLAAATPIEARTKRVG